MDRITYSFGMTIPGAEDYSSIRFEVRIESDQKKGETTNNALDRVKKLVMEQVNSEYDKIKEATTAD